MMRILKLLVAVLFLGGLAVPMLGCAAESAAAEPSESEVVTVERGNLIINITAVGNLALSRTEDLAFDIFYQEATVEEVLVEEGDTVKEGQLLATLEISEWEDELSTLEDRVTTAERQLTAAERQLTTKQRALVQAEINLKNAQIALEQTQSTYYLPDIKVAEAAVIDAQRNLEETLIIVSKYEEGTPGYDLYQKTVVQAQTQLDTAEAKLDAMLSGYDTEEVAVKKLQVEQNELALQEAQNAMEDARVAIEDARKDLGDAQEELDEARSKSQEIRATFDGFITRVNIEGGEEVMTGTVAVQLADPEKFEAEVMVGEMDIIQVKEGGEAWVEVDAMQGLSLPATVTHIAPTATIQSGVVNYRVKVEIESLEARVQERQAAQQEAMQKIQQGELPERMKQAVEEGRLTQEQAEEMVKQRQQAQTGQQGQANMATPEDFQLREGLTVMVSIVVEEKNDVLLVPNSALTRQGGQTYVQVLSADGAIEECIIETGISDYQYTEVTSGLSEGEQVTIPQGTTTSTPTTSQQGPPGGIVPGMGRMMR